MAVCTVLKDKERYKTLLVSVSRVWRYSNTGLDQIAGYLRENQYNFEIKYYHHGQNVADILNDIPMDYDLYGFSVHSSNYEKCCEICKIIKQFNPKSIILFGGSFPTIYYREIMKQCDFLDYIILGDGEKPIQTLIDSLINSSEKIVNESIVTKYDNLNKRPFCNTEILYKPIFDYYENDTKEKNVRKIHCIQTKNNICTGKCAFCIERKGPIVYKNIDQIVDEIKYVAQNYGVKKFFFTDDNLLDPNNRVAKERVKELCYKIQELKMNLVFECYIKAISLNDSEYDNELLQLMSETGFVTIFVGVESGSNQDLVLYNKFTTVEDNYSIINLLNHYNLHLLMGFIYYNPYSTLQTLRENYDFLINIKSTNLFHYVSTFLNIHKYTAIYDKARKDGLIKSDFDMLNNMSYEFVDKDVNKIVIFIREYMTERVKKLDYEFDWIYSYYQECTRVNPIALKYDEELKNIKEQQFELIKHFFYYLYVKNDLDKCKNSVDNFMAYFENIQDRLSEIYKDLVMLFSY